MGEPLLKYEDEDKPSSATEKARRSWGMDGDTSKESENDEHDARTGREKANENWGMTPEEIAEQEQSANNTEEDAAAADENDSGFYNDEGKPSKQSKRVPTKAKVGGGVVGLILSAGILFSVIFAPIAKLESFLSRINDRVFGAASSAVETRIDSLFSHYMIRHIRSLESCGQKRSIDCKADYSGSGLAGGLFSTWRDVKVEEKIFDRMGFSIESTDLTDSADGKHRFTLRDRRGNKITFSGVEDFDEFKKGSFTGGRRELGRELKAIIKDEMKHDGVMQRRSVRKYLERKHGLKLYCFFACNTRDDVDRKTTDAKTRYKKKFVERFVLPISPKYGFIFGCVLDGASGDKCTPEKAREFGVSERKVDDAELKRILSRVDTEPGRKFTEILVDEMIEKFLKGSAKVNAKTAAKGIPIAGQVYFALSILDMFDKLDTYIDDNGLSKMAAAVNSAQYIEWYAGMRTFNDELKNNAVSLDEIEAVMEEFDGAEASRVYQARYGGEDAAGYEAVDTDYKCTNSQPIPEGEFVCNEKKVARTYAVQDWQDSAFGTTIDVSLSGYRDFCLFPVPPSVGPIKSPCPATPKKAFRVVDGLIGAIAGAVSDLILKPILEAGKFAIEITPYGKEFIQLITEKGAELVQAFFQVVFPFPISEDSPARVKYDGLEAGGELAAYEFTQGGYDESDQPYGLGGTELSSAQAQAVEADYNEQLAYEYQRQPILDRLADTDYEHSFANQALASLPTTRGGFVNSMFSVFSNFFNTIGSTVFNFGLPSQKAYAAGDQIPSSPFGIPKYGYAMNDPALTQDPAEITEEDCAKGGEIRTKWERSKYQHKLTGFDEYRETNPCLLEEAAIEGAGLYFTND